MSLKKGEKRNLVGQQVSFGTNPEETYQNQFLNAGYQKIHEDESDKMQKHSEKIEQLEDEDHNSSESNDNSDLEYEPIVNTSIIQFLILFDILITIFAIANTSYLSIFFLKFRDLIDKAVFPYVLTPIIFFCLYLLFNLNSFYSIAVLSIRKKRKYHLYQVQTTIIFKVIFLCIILSSGGFYGLDTFFSPENLRPLLYHKIKHAYMERDSELIIHQFQQEMKCCGVRHNKPIVTEKFVIPKNSSLHLWFKYHILEDNFKDSIAGLYTLPWSCCNLNKTNCFHFGISRYIQKDQSFSSFLRDENSVNGQSWHSIRYDGRILRRREALESIHVSDCSDQLYDHLRNTAKTISSSFIILGISNLCVNIFLLFARSKLTQKQSDISNIMSDNSQKSSTKDATIMDSASKKYEV